MPKKPAPTLSSAHLALLSAAAARKDGLVVRPESLIVPTFRKLGQRLLNGAFAAEISVRGAMPVWRTDEDGRRYAMRITAAGRRVLAAGQNGSSDGQRDATAPAPVRRHGSKLTLVLEALQKPQGATLATIVAATGWQPHSARAALCRLRQGGHAIATAREATGTVYRLASPSETR